MAEITVHADELRYTPTGLQTTESLPLVVGEHNRIVIVRPDVVKAVPVGYGAFMPNSSFPTPGVMMLGTGAAIGTMIDEILGPSAGDRYYQFYGHAGPTNEAERNKHLTDRRAQVVAAFFAADIDKVASIADAEGWGLREHQIMLRVLRCDPGAIDGEPGVMTAAATKLFTRDYADGIFHRHVELTPRDPALPLAEELDARTIAALVEAYVIACSPHIPPEQLHPTHPTVGCSEFNVVAEDDPIHNRRVSLVVHDGLPPFHDRAPCVEGDHTQCPLDEVDSRYRCPWYRAHVEDQNVHELVHQHIDLRWLELPNEKILLSALTSLPDESAISFQVFRSRPIAAPEELSPEELDEPLSEEMSGIIRGGIAQVVWDPPAGFDLREVDAWYEPMQTDIDRRAIWDAPQKMRVPVFRVIGGGVTALSRPPGEDAGRIHSERGTDYQGDLPDSIMGVDAFGRLFGLELENGRVVTTRSPLDPAEPMLVGLRFGAAHYHPEAHDDD